MLTVILLFSFLAQPFESHPLFIRGDANSDQRVNISDVVTILEFLFDRNKSTLEACLDAGDTNDNGGINFADAIYLLQYLYSGGTPPPPPFGELNIDPTADQLFCGG